MGQTQIVNAITDFIKIPGKNHGLRAHEWSGADRAARSYHETVREHGVLHRGDPGEVAAP